MLVRSGLLEAIHEVADPTVVWPRIVEQCLTFVPHADGASLEMRRDAETLEYVAGAGTLASFVGLRLQVRSSLSGLAALTGEMQRCDDVESDPRVDVAAVHATRIASMLCVPLAHGLEGIAVLKISSQTPTAFTDEDLARVEQVAEFLAVTVRAVSDIAQVTSSMLEERGDAVGASSSLVTARFVANVMAPGLVADVDEVERIRGVLDTDLTVHVQPIIDLQSRATVALEALARFPGHPQPTPDWWFLNAHRVGLGVELELHAVRAALALFAVLPAEVRLSVNAGPAALLHPGFLGLVRSVPTTRLTIELTEHTRVTDYEPLLAVRAELKELGVRLAMDDAGSGFAGLSQLRRLLPDIVKIDRDLVAGVDEDPVRQTLCRALVDFACRIGAYVIGEGVETEAEAAMLQSLGVERAQGYLFGRPVAVPTFMQGWGTAGSVG